MDEHVRVIDELPHDVGTGVALQVESNRAFATVRVGEPAAHAAFLAPVLAQVVPLVDSFDLHDGGALHGQEMRGRRHGDHLPHLNNADAFEWPGHELPLNDARKPRHYSGNGPRAGSVRPAGRRHPQLNEMRRS